MKKVSFRNSLGRWTALTACFSLGLVLAACSPIVGRSSSQEVPGGDLQRGQRLVVEYGCHSCHTIPGVREAKATVGPPLNDWADRHYIAGALSNTPDNLILWLREPQSIEPGTAMPDMGVTDQDARDIAAYLFNLRRNNLFQIPAIGLD